MSTRDNLKAEEGLIGQLINDRFRIKALLGRGNVGVVYRATDVRDSRQVALKIIKFDLAEQGLQTRFDREANVVAQIQHPNAVTIHEYGSLNTGGGYFAMEFIEGMSLRDLLKNSRTLPLDQALSITKQIASAVSAAHKVGVIHRDLKPENVMLPASATGYVKVTDFGLAKLKEGVGQSKANLTSAGEVMGTPCYMSPEQCLGTGVDERTDIYALGIILFEMLAGKPPFEGNFFSVLRMHMSKPLPSIREFAANVPKVVEDFINELLNKEKDQRPRSIDEVLDKIEQMQKTVLGPAATTAPQSVSAPAAKVQPMAMAPPSVTKPQAANPPVTTPTVAAPPATSAASGQIKPLGQPAMQSASQQAPSNTVLYIVAAIALVIILLVAVWALK
ncbi:MAG: protein kinase [Acidobacteriota bacterium]